MQRTICEQLANDSAQDRHQGSVAEVGSHDSHDLGHLCARPRTSIYGGERSSLDDLWDAGVEQIDNLADEVRLVIGHVCRRVVLGEEP